VAHLRGEALVVEEQRRVGETDRDLRDVLHLHEHVDRTVEIRRDRRVVVGDRRPPLGRAGELAELGDAFRRTPQDQDVVGNERLLAIGVDDPLLAPADGDDAHADLHRQLDVGERPVRERRVFAHTHPVRDLLGLREIGDEGGGDAEPVRHDPGHVHGRVRHPLDRRDDVQHARHLFCFARRARGEHADLVHLMHEVAQPLLELPDLVGHALVGEEERGVCQVDHELGRVLGLREHGLEVARWLVGFCHGYESPRITRDTMNAAAPRKSDDDDTSGTPLLSGSHPSR
jgi:hypothetical protein